MSTVALNDLARAGSRTVAGSGRGMRRHNRDRVLRALRNETTASRADLARLTGLTRPTISELVKHLLAEGVVIEVGQSRSSRPGKPAVMLRLAHDTSPVIALDLSSPALIRAALCSSDGEILEERTAPLGADAVATALALTRELAASVIRPLIGIGVGLPVQTWSSAGTAADLAFTDRLSRALHADTGARVHVTNVADLAALAEHRHGRAGEFLLVRRSERTSTALHLGQGEHARATARELAHVVVEDETSDAAPLCGCGQPGCLHSWVSPAALRARIRSSSREREVRRTAARHLGAALAAITGALDLHRVVISETEGVIDADFCADVAAVLSEARALPHSTSVDVDASVAGSSAVLRGAAAYVVSAELGVR